MPRIYVVGPKVYTSKEAKARYKLRQGQQEQGEQVEMETFVDAPSHKSGISATMEPVDRVASRTKLQRLKSDVSIFFVSSGHSFIIYFSYISYIQHNANLEILTL